MIALLKKELQLKLIYQWSMNKIIVIDDTLHLLEEITDLLGMEGYEVFTAHDAVDGMKKIETYNPDLIITDILMPEVDGFALISMLRSKEAYRDTPIIVLSAGAAKENEKRALSLEANAYISKPCSANELLSSIQKFIK